MGFIHLWLRILLMVLVLSDCHKLFHGTLTLLASCCGAWSMLAWDIRQLHGHQYEYVWCVCRRGDRSDAGGVA